MKCLVTGGAGFIGSALVRHILEDSDASVINVDALTYVGNLESMPGATDLFTEATPYAPSSPYSASKAGSDYLVRAWGRTELWAVGRRDSL
ncbi:MAG: dTDP-D-glucose 4,6-dehydratase [Zhongshania sp.]|jgi:dTDP-D-glucose 4,6-dehydratase